MTMPSIPKNFDYGNDICLFFNRTMDFGQIALDLEKNAGKIDLKVKTNKIKVLSVRSNVTLLICMIGQNVEKLNSLLV